MNKPIKLPEPPPMRLLGFDESCSISAYGKSDLIAYATKAVEFDRANRDVNVFVRIWMVIRNDR